MIERSCLTPTILQFSQERIRSTTTAVQEWNEFLKSVGGNATASAVKTAFDRLHNATTHMGAWDQFRRNLFRDVKKSEFLNQTTRLIAIASATRAGVPEETLKEAGILGKGESSAQSLGAGLNWLLDHAMDRTVQESLTFGEGHFESGAFTGRAKFAPSVPLVGGYDFECSGLRVSKYLVEGAAAIGLPHYVLDRIEQYIPEDFVKLGLTNYALSVEKRSEQRLLRRQFDSKSVASGFSAVRLTTLLALSRTIGAPHNVPQLTRLAALTYVLPSSEGELVRTLVAPQIQLLSVDDQVRINAILYPTQLPGEHGRQFDTLLAVSGRLSPIDQHAFLLKLRDELRKLPVDVRNNAATSLANKLVEAFSGVVGEACKLPPPEMLKRLIELCKLDAWIPEVVGSTHTVIKRLEGFNKLLAGCGQLLPIDRRELLDELQKSLRFLMSSVSGQAAEELTKKDAEAFAELVDDVFTRAGRDVLGILIKLGDLESPWFSSGSAREGAKINGFDTLVGASARLAPAERHAFLVRVGKNIKHLPSVRRNQAARDLAVADANAFKEMVDEVCRRPPKEIFKQLMKLCDLETRLPEYFGRTAKYSDRAAGYEKLNAARDYLSRVDRRSFDEKLGKDLSRLGSLVREKPI